MEDAEDSQDLLLIRRVLAGESSAFGQLLLRHQEVLSRFCRSRLGDPDEADDAVQDVFLRAYRSLSSFRVGQSFRSWLFGIAANRVKTRYAARDARRGLKERLRGETMIRHPEGLGGDAEEDALRSIDEQAIRLALQGLNRGNRRVAELYYMGGLSVEEVCQSLGLGAEAVKSRLFRARKAMKKALDATFGREGR